MNKTVIITGASRGIGAATALRFAKQGYKVCINYKEQKAAAVAIVERIAELGMQAIAIQADVSDESEVKQLFASSQQEFGQIDVLVNNAGILFTQCRLTDLSAERINAVLSNNVTSQFLCCKQAILHMSSRFGGAGGAIVNVSSAASRIGSAGEYIDYAASKGAVDTLTIGLSQEVAAEGIRVNCVRPGLIYTDMHASGGEPKRVDRLKTGLPLQRGGDADEVAAAIYWLASDEASYTTGAFIEVSGGR